MRVVRGTLFAALVIGVVGALPAVAAAEVDYAPEAGSAHAAEASPLDPALQQLAKPSVRALPEAEQARLLGIAADGPGSLIRSDGRILVNARFEGGALARLPALRRLGGEVLDSSQRYQEVSVNVPFRQLDELAEVGGIAAVVPAQTPVLRELEQCQGGLVISEGVQQLKVELAREELKNGSEPSKEGEGLTVGVLSDSFDQATEAVSGGPVATRAPNDIISKDLPGLENNCPGQEAKVEDLQDYIVGEGQQPPFDEGRAMLQIVHDVVPKAKLAFYSAFNSEADFAEGIEELAKPISEGGKVGANVIVDDVSYFEEPFFQDGPVAAAIDKVVGEGVTYLTAAGNDNAFAGTNEIPSWETPRYTDSFECPPAVRAFGGHDCLDFNPEAAVDRTFGIKVKAGATLTVDLQWNEPWHGVGTDLDTYLLDAEGRLLTLKQVRNARKFQRPVEWMQWTNGTGAEATVQLVVNRFSGSTPRTKFILLENGSGGVTATEYPSSGGGNVVGPSIYGHAGTAAAITVGAVPWNESKLVEPYSSRGPVTHYWAPVLSGTEAPAERLVTPQAISKPDIVATDCNRTTFFARNTVAAPHTWRFCGTSAAAPHAAGLAALAIEASGGLATPEAVLKALAGTGSAVAEFGPCAAAGGLLNAALAVEAIEGKQPEATPATCSPPNASGAVVRASGEWGRESPLTPVAPETPVTPQPPLTPPTQPVTPPSEESKNTGTKNPPVTAIGVHPQKVVSTSRARVRLRFGFAADASGATFICQFDGSVYRSCPAQVSRWFGLGPHVVKVKAMADGLLDRSPAVFRFKVVRDSQARRSSHRRAAR